MDRKLVSDPALPLSDAQLKISETFIFVGWLLGAVALHPLMQRLDLKQVRGGEGSLPFWGLDSRTNQ